MITTRLWFIVIGAGLTVGVVIGWAMVAVINYLFGG